MLKFASFSSRSMAPAAKKLKGGLRKVFKRNYTEGSGNAAGFTLSDDEDDTDDEADQSKQSRPSSMSHFPAPRLDFQAWNERTDLQGLGTISCSSEQGPSFEASPDLHATVAPLVAPKTMRDPETFSRAVKPELSTNLRSISEPIPSTSHVCERRDGKVQGEDPLRAWAQTEKMTQVEEITPNCFNNILPRELQLAVLKALVDIHEEEQQRIERGEYQGKIWSVRTASKARWVGRNKGLRELVKFTRVGLFPSFLCGVIRCSMAGFKDVAVPRIGWPAVGCATSNIIPTASPSRFTFTAGRTRRTFRALT